MTWMPLTMPRACPCMARIARASLAVSWVAERKARRIASTTIAPRSVRSPKGSIARIVSTMRGCSTRIQPR